MAQGRGPEHLEGPTLELFQLYLSSLRDLGTQYDMEVREISENVSSTARTVIQTISVDNPRRWAKIINPETEGLPRRFALISVAQSMAMLTIQSALSERRRQVRQGDLYLAMLEVGKYRFWPWNE